MAEFDPGIRPVSPERLHAGPRRRKKTGNLQSLAESIKREGVLHPIIVRDGTEIVSGVRRWEAAKLAGMPTVPVRDLIECSDEELREIELIENVERKDLDALEVSEQRLKAISVAKAKPGPTDGQVSRGSRGPARTPGSQRDVADRLNLSRDQQQKAKKHVSLAERFPFLRGSDNGSAWPRSAALRAGELLATLPETEHEAISKLFVGAEIPASEGLRVLDHLRLMGPSPRKTLYERAETDLRGALDWALRDVPEPDPAHVFVDQALAALRKATTVATTDTAKDHLGELVSLCLMLSTDLAAEHRERLSHWRQGTVPPVAGDAP